MTRAARLGIWQLVPITVGALLLALFVQVCSVSAITRIPDPDPIPGSYGLEATKPQPPPTVGASISTPANGATFTESPITINGICPKGLLVEVFNNGVMAGAVMCTDGSFSLQVSLFAGTNELKVIDYDDLGQAGPESSVITVTYKDTNLTAFGQLITLTSSYGRRSAAAGSTLSWPLQLSGGTGPYAFSIDWGDGSKPDLKSQALAGVVTISHVYKNAGIYQVNIKVTDVNGVSAFLQVIAVANGKVDASVAAGGSKNKDDEGTKTAAKPQILWLPTAIALVLLLPSFWLGRLSQMVSIRHKMLHDRDRYEAEQKT